MTAVLQALALLICQPPPPPQPPAPAIVVTPTAAVARAYRSLPPGPTLAQSLRAALARNSMSTARARSAVRRARLAGLLPTVDVTFDAGADRQLRLDQEPGVADALTTDAQAARGLRIRASWDLDRLIFDSDELRATRTVLDVLDHRAAVVERVAQLYARRQELLLERALSDPARDDPAALVSRSVALSAVEGLLEAATGLRFASRGPTSP